MVHISTINFLQHSHWLIFDQGDCQRHQEAPGRSDRGVPVHPRHAGEAGTGASQERFCQAQQKIQQHTQGVLQGGPVSDREK